MVFCQKIADGINKSQNIVMYIEYLMQEYIRSSLRIFIIITL